MNEQTKQDDAGNRTAKANQEISSSSLQNPSDPDATFREKAGKAHKGYVGNIVETVDEDGHSLITGFAFQPNTHSDSSFCKEQIKKHTADNNRETIIADGAYGGSENQKLAEAHNVELITTALTGKTPDEVFAGFVFNEAGTEVVSCPVGKAPQKSTLYKKSGMLRVLMPKDCCSNCPYQKNCRAKKQKHAYAVMVSPKKVERALYLQKLSTEEYLKLTRMRNAAEGVPSVLRRRYRVDHSQFRGKIRTGWTYALAVGANNIRKLISSRRSPRGKCA